MTPQGSAEKRSYRRIAKKIVLRVESNGKSKEISPWTLVTTQNFSAGGVLFTYDKKISEGTKLHLKMHFPDRAIGCDAVVHRTLPGAQEPLVNVAASLEGLNPMDKEIIESYIR